MENTDKLYYYTNISHFEENLVITKNYTNLDFINISYLKMNLNYICKLNKQLKILNEELKSIHFSNDWVENAKLSKILKIRLKILLKKVKFNKFKVNCNQMKLRNSSRVRMWNKRKRYKLHTTYLCNKKEYFDDKINVWMKEQQNEIFEQKERKKLKKDADIILTDIRIKHLNAKKILFILQELNLYRKLKADVSRTNENFIPTEANHVIDNIFAKLIHQWKTLSREYCIEEKGLKLMTESYNKDKAVKHTKNIFYDWEKNLFKNKVSLPCQLNEKNDSTVRLLWDSFLKNNEGNEMPTGWIVPGSSSSYGWIKYTK